MSRAARSGVPPPPLAAGGRLTLNTRRGAPLGPWSRPLLSRYARQVTRRRRLAHEENILDSDTLKPENLLKIEGAQDEMQDPFRPHVAAITISSVVDRYPTVTQPLLDRYMSVTSVTPLQTLKPWIFWRSGEVLSVKC